MITYPHLSLATTYSHMTATPNTKFRLSLAALALLFSPLLPAQEVPPAFVQPAPEELPDGSHAPKNVRIQCEFIQMSHKDATRLMIEDDTKTFNATKMRIKVQKMVDENKATIIDTQVVHARSGEKATTESIAERIYPTEYALIPLRDSDAKTTKSPSAAPLLPTAFETRNVGSTLEVEPTISEDDTMVSLSFRPDLVWYTGKSTWAEYKGSNGMLNKVEMPEIYTIRMNGAITCMDRQFCYAAMLSPKNDQGIMDQEQKVLVFIRCVVLPVVP